VLWNYLRHIAQQAIVLSTTLSLIGFVLVSSPLWGSIIVKGPQWEISLLKQQAAAQAENNLKLVEAYQRRLPPQQAAQIAPTVDQLRASVQRLQQVTDDTKKTAEVLRLTEQLTSTVIKTVP
jgi:hypothetical protein